MKILSNLLLCALLLCAISSCQKDDDNLLITVQGKWDVTEVSCQDGIQTVFENGATSGGAFVFEGQSFSSEIEFKADASFKGTGQYTKVFSTLVNGTMDINSSKASDFAKEGAWKKMDTNLELTHHDVETFEIIELTSDKMRLKLNLDETLEDNQRIINNMGTVFYTLRRK